LAAMRSVRVAAGRRMRWSVMTMWTASSVRVLGMWQVTQFSAERWDEAWQPAQTLLYAAAAASPRGISCGLWQVVQSSLPLLLRKHCDWRKR